MWCLYYSSWIHHATEVLPLNVERFLLSLLFQIINEMLSSSRSNIQSCITTLSKLSMHHWLPPLRKLSIAVNIDGFLEGFQAPLLNVGAKINVNLFSIESFAWFWCNNRIIILLGMPNSAQWLMQASEVCWPYPLPVYLEISLNCIIYALEQHTIAFHKNNNAVFLVFLVYQCVVCDHEKFVLTDSFIFE